RLKGFMDLQANIDSAEASDVRAAMSKLKPAEVRPFLEEISLFGSYAHGTHVTGIMVAGNPYARMVLGRISFDYKMVPDLCPSRELSARNAAAMEDFVNFFRRTGVRVVNMSWGESVRDFEHQMEQCGTGRNTDERKTLARQIYDIEKAGMEKAFRSAPDMLFVAAAGNANSDSTFNEFIPSSLVLPNLLTVGAVDLAGDEAPFTSYGPTVAVHAN